MALVVVALVGPVAAAHAEVTPSAGGRYTAFTVTFPAQPVILELQLEGPGRCATLDPLVISIARAQAGRFRFGPRVPGARPRRDGRRLTRWCSGPFRVDVVATGEFEPTAELIATDRFTVR